MLFILKSKTLYKKATCSMILFLCHSGKGKITERENRSVVARSLGPGAGIKLQGALGEYSEKMKISHILTVMIVTYLCAFFQNSQNCTLERIHLQFVNHTSIDQRFVVLFFKN
jgi:hypothetical protein